MRSRSLSKFAVLLLAVTFAQHVAAQPCSITVRQFRDRTAFLRVTGALAEPPLPARGRVATPFSVGSLSLSYTAPSSAMFCSEWTALHPGNELARAKRLDHVILGMLFQPLDDGAFVANGR